MAFSTPTEIPDRVRDDTFGFLGKSSVFVYVLPLLALIAMLAAPARAQLADVIPQQDRLVVDEGDLLSPGEERRLEQTLRAYDDSTSTQIVVVTLRRLGGVPAADYATALGRQWGVGQQGKDNGAVILVSKEDREMFIATGFGLEGSIPDITAGHIVRDVMRPAFRRGQFYAGLSGATDALMAAARGEYEAEPAARSRGEDRGINMATLFILLIIAFFVISAIRDGYGDGGSGGSGDGSGRKRRQRRSGGVFPIFIGGGGGGSSGGFGGGGGFSGGGGFGGFGGGGFGGGGAGGSW